MEAPISASHGAMLSLPGKLESLLLEPPGHGLTKGEKTKIHLLKGDLEELIANYLMEPSEVDAPALTANCWVKEVRELSYDIDDFVKELVHVDADAKVGVVQKTPRVKITRFRENLNRRRGIADEISGFRTRVKEAIKLHKNYNLGSCSFRPWRNSDEHPLPPLYGVGTARLVHRDDLWDKLHGWLTDDGEQQQRVASIVGIGGVGKTTLAKQVYDKLGGRFECRAFVRTSRKADMRRLLTSMLSQLRRHDLPEADAAWEVHNLIDKIRARLIHKKYFIIIDDLWSTSTWDIVSRALPDNPCSRILLTTEFDIVAQMCCGYNSKYIFKMEPLSEDGSRELFFSTAFGHQHDCPEQLNEVSYEIIRKCGGLPLATITIASLLASQPNRKDQWKYIQNSLSSILRTDPTLERMQQVLNVSYNNLPHRLKACMLYLSMYQESHIIWKHDLVNRWIVEDFISVVEGEDMEEIAGSYFDELVKRGMIQPVYINYNGEVLSCAVHYIVLNFIRYKSMEENFVCAIDHSQTNVRLTNKVRRLSLHFGDAEDVTPPSLRLLQVRSVGFFGLFKCMPSILEFKLLQVLILQLWVDDYDMSYNFTEISKLFRLRHLHINAFHLSVQLPTQMQRLKDLVTLEIERRVAAVPSDIVDLPRLLHLSLPSEAALPNSIGRMTSLRTLGYFSLSSNSKDNVLNLGELTNLRDLRLTCSTVPSVNLEDNMQCLSTILWKLSRLKSLTLAPEFSHTKTTDASVSSMSISGDGLGSVSSPPTLLQRLELLPRICIFSSLPEWIRKLDRLSILRIAVRGLSMNDIDILKGLLTLTALSLYVRTAPVERIVFDKAGFPILKYLKFMCTAPCLAFEEGAMPTVRRLKLGSNAHRAEQYDPVLSSIKYLLSLEEITVIIGRSDRTAAKPVLWDAITKHPSIPIINIRYVDWIFYCEEDADRQHGILEMNTGKDTTQEQEQPSLENQYENVEVDSDRQHEILEMNMGKDMTQEQEHPSSENQYENVEVDSDRQHGILEMNTADCRISMSPESSSHLPSPVMQAALASVMLKVAGDKLVQLITGKFTSNMGVRKDLSELQDLFGEITAWLSAVGDITIASDSLVHWLINLKNVAYDIDDLLYEAHLEAEKHKADGDGGKHVMANNFYAKPKSIVFRFKMARKIKTIKERFAAIVKQRFEFNAIVNNVPVDHPDWRNNRTIGDMSILGNVGVSTIRVRDEEKQRIISKLVETNEREKILTVSIVGLGGSGKTTLAKHICEDEKIKEHFQAEIYWVHVSEEFDLLKLIGKLFEAVSNKESDLETNQKMVEEISEKLNHKKFLLVLDDAWHEHQQEWVQFTGFLSSGAPGSRILLTTRSERVSKAMESTTYLFNLELLQPDDSWKFFQQCYGWAEDDMDSEFIEIGKDIVRRCGGVPLAIKTIAGMLNEREINAWQAGADLQWIKDLLPGGPARPPEGFRVRTSGESQPSPCCAACAPAACSPGHLRARPADTLYPRIPDTANPHFSILKSLTLAQSATGGSAPLRSATSKRASPPPPSAPPARSGAEGLSLSWPPAPCPRRRPARPAPVRSAGDRASPPPPSAPPARSGAEGLSGPPAPALRSAAPLLRASAAVHDRRPTTRDRTRRAFVLRPLRTSAGSPASSPPLCLCGTPAPGHRRPALQQLSNRSRILANCQYIQG